MQQHKFSHNDGHILRINKTEARRRYTAGETIFLMPSNFAPGHWVSPFDISLSDEAAKDCLDSKMEFIRSQANFDNRVNSFEYYNCSDRESGLYSSYYKLVA